MIPCKEFRDFCKSCKHVHKYWNGPTDSVAQYHCGLNMTRKGNPRVVFMDQNDGSYNEAVEDFNESLEKRDAGMTMCPMFLEFLVITQ